MSKRVVLLALPNLSELKSLANTINTKLRSSVKFLLIRYTSVEVGHYIGQK